MKKRYLAAALVMAVVVFGAAVLAANADLLLCGEPATPVLSEIIIRLRSSPKALLLTLLLSACGALFVYWALFGNVYLNYRSEMYEVTPGFEIPMPAGQGQYGTAWFLDTKQYDTAFSSAATPERLPLSAELQAKYEAERRAAKNVEL